MSDYGLDVEQLRFDVIRPALQWIELWSPAAENLTLGTWLHESHAKWLRQTPRGPALGLGQMERVTHDDIHRNFLSYQPELRDKVNALAMRFSGEMPDASQLISNLLYAAAMTRVHYRRDKHSLPAPLDAQALAETWKRWYNTPRGAGTVAQALPHFERATELR